MARLRFPGRPGYRFDRLGIRYGADEAKNVSDPALTIVANIHRGLRAFREIFGESDEEEEFEGFDVRDVKKAEKKLKAALEDDETEEEIEMELVDTPICSGTRFSHARSSLDELPASERTRGRIKAVVRKSYKELIKQGLTKPSKSHFIKKVKDLSSPVKEAKKVLLQRNSQDGRRLRDSKSPKVQKGLDTSLGKIKIKLSPGGEKGRIVKGVLNKSPHYKERLVKRKVSTQKLSSVSIKRTERNVAKQLLHHAKQAKKSTFTPATHRKQFVLPTQSSRSSRVIKPNKRFLEDDSFHIIITKRPKTADQNDVQVATPSDGGDKKVVETSFSSPDKGFSKSIFHTPTKFRPEFPNLSSPPSNLGSGLSSRPGLFEMPLVLEGKRERKPSLKMRMKLTENSEDSTLKKVIEESCKTYSWEAGKSDSSTAASTSASKQPPVSIRSSALFAPPKFGVSAFSSINLSQFRKSGMGNEGQTEMSRWRGSSILRKAKFQLNMTALNRSKAALARSLKAQMKKEAKLERKLKRQRKLGLAPAVPIRITTAMSGSYMDKVERPQLTQDDDEKAASEKMDQSPEIESCEDPIVSQTDVETKKFAARRNKCAVCQDSSLMHGKYYYGVPSCDSCRKFYRGQVTKLKKRKLFCKFEGKCKITKETKKDCSACRLRKCRRVFPKVEELQPNRANIASIIVRTSEKSQSTTQTSFSAGPVIKLITQTETSPFFEISKKTDLEASTETIRRELTPLYDDSKKGETIFRPPDPLVSSSQGDCEKMKEMEDKTSKKSTSTREALKEIFKAKQEKSNKVEKKEEYQNKEALDSQMKHQSSALLTSSPESLGDSPTSEVRGPRIKHVCRNASMVLGKPIAKFPSPKSEIRLSALPVQEKAKILKKDELEKAEFSDDEQPLQGIKQKGEDTSVTFIKSPPPPKRVQKPQQQKFRMGKRKVRCKVCKGCLALDCGTCRHCQDKPKFGGPGLLKQACVERRCENPRYARAATSAFISVKSGQGKDGTCDVEAAVDLEQKSTTNRTRGGVTSIHHKTSLSQTGRGQEGIMKQPDFPVPELSFQNVRSGRMFRAGNEVRRLNFDLGGQQSNVTSATREGCAEVLLPKMTETQGRKEGRLKDKLGFGRQDTVTLQPVLSTIRHWRSGSLEDQHHLVRADFMEDYDLEYAWVNGMSLTMSGPVCVRSVCYLCGSSGKHKLIYCTLCCEPYHEFCLEDSSPSKEDLENWCCSRCQFCHVCGRQNNLLQCDKCQNTYHPECLGPNYPTKPSKKGIWICSKCVRCKSCGATTPGTAWNATWTYNFSLCYECGKLMDKGNFCPVCHKCYSDDDWESKMIQCSSCDSWVHARCEGLNDEMYNILSYLPEDVSYICQVCKGNQTNELPNILQHEFFVRLRDVIHSLVISKCAQHLIRIDEKKEENAQDKKSPQKNHSSVGNTTSEDCDVGPDENNSSVMDTDTLNSENKISQNVMEETDMENTGSDVCASDVSSLLEKVVTSSELSCDQTVLPKETTLTQPTSVISDSEVNIPGTEPCDSNKFECCKKEKHESNELYSKIESVCVDEDDKGEDKEIKFVGKQQGENNLKDSDVSGVNFELCGSDILSDTISSCDKTELSSDLMSAASDNTYKSGCTVNIRSDLLSVSNEGEHVCRDVSVINSEGQYVQEGIVAKASDSVSVISVASREFSSDLVSDLKPSKLDSAQSESLDTDAKCGQKELLNQESHKAMDIGEHSSEVSNCKKSEKSIHTICTTVSEQTENVDIIGTFDSKQLQLVNSSQEKPNIEDLTGRKNEQSEENNPISEECGKESENISISKARDCKSELINMEYALDGHQSGLAKVEESRQDMNSNLETELKPLTDLEESDVRVSTESSKISVEKDVPNSQAESVHASNMQSASLKPELSSHGNQSDCSRPKSIQVRFSLEDPVHITKKHPKDLNQIKIKLEERKYSTVEEFSEDIVRVIMTALANPEEQKQARKKAINSVRSIFIKQMERCFPWYNVKTSKLWDINQSWPDRMLPDATLPPYIDHTYAQWLEREEPPVSPQPSPFKRISGTPMKKLSSKALLESDEGIESSSLDMSVEAGEDVRRCILCSMLGDQDHNDAGRLLYSGQDDWIHINCALWSAEVYEDSNGSLQNVQEAYSRGKMLKCDLCQKSGATVGCNTRGCPANYHFMCARGDNCVFQEDKKVFCKFHHDRVDGDLVEDNNFAVLRRVYVSQENIRYTKKPWSRGLNPAEINIIIGSSTVECLGRLTPLSDQRNYLVPVDFMSTRIYWSTQDCRRRCVYTCRVIEIQPEAQSPKVIMQDIRIVHDESHPDYVPLSELNIPGLNICPKQFPLTQKSIEQENIIDLTQESVMEVCDLTRNETPVVQNHIGNIKFCKMQESITDSSINSNSSKCLSSKASSLSFDTASLSASWPLVAQKKVKLQPPIDLSKLSPNTLKCLNIKDPEKYLAGSSKESANFTSKSVPLESAQSEFDVYNRLNKVVERLNEAAARATQRKVGHSSLPSSRPRSQNSISSRSPSVERMLSSPGDQPVGFTPPTLLPRRSKSEDRSFSTLTTEANSTILNSVTRPRSRSYEEHQGYENDKSKTESILSEESRAVSAPVLEDIFVKHIGLSASTESSRSVDSLQIISDLDPISEETDSVPEFESPVSFENLLKDLSGDGTIVVMTEDPNISEEEAIQLAQAFLEQSNSSTEERANVEHVGQEKFQEGLVQPELETVNQCRHEQSDSSVTKDADKEKNHDVNVQKVAMETKYVDSCTQMEVDSSLEVIEGEALDSCNIVGTDRIKKTDKIDDSVLLKLEDLTVEMMECDGQSSEAVFNSGIEQISRETREDAAAMPLSCSTPGQRLERNIFDTISNESVNFEDSDLTDVGTSDSFQSLPMNQAVVSTAPSWLKKFNLLRDSETLQQGEMHISGKQAKEGDNVTGLITKSEGNDGIMGSSCKSDSSKLSGASMACIIIEDNTDEQVSVSLTTKVSSVCSQTSQGQKELNEDCKVLSDSAKVVVVTSKFEDSVKQDHDIPVESRQPDTVLNLKVRLNERGDGSNVEKMDDPNDRPVCMTNDLNDLMNAVSLPKKELKDIGVSPRRFTAFVDTDSFDPSCHVKKLSGNSAEKEKQDCDEMHKYADNKIDEEEDKRVHGKGENVIVDEVDGDQLRPDSLLDSEIGDYGNVRLYGGGLALGDRSARKSVFVNHVTNSEDNLCSEENTSQKVTSLSTAQNCDINMKGDFTCSETKTSSQSGNNQDILNIKEEKCDRKNETVCNEKYDKSVPDTSSSTYDLTNEARSETKMALLRGLGLERSEDVEKAKKQMNKTSPFPLKDYLLKDKLGNSYKMRQAKVVLSPLKIYPLRSKTTQITVGTNPHKRHLSFYDKTKDKLVNSGYDDNEDGEKVKEKGRSGCDSDEQELPLHDRIAQKIKMESLAKSSPGDQGPFKCPTCKRMYRTQESYQNHVKNCDFEVSTSDEEEEDKDKEDNPSLPKFRRSTVFQRLAMEAEMRQKSEVVSPSTTGGERGQKRKCSGDNPVHFIESSGYVNTQFTPERRGRGRPRKVPHRSVEVEEKEVEEPVVKRGRGRPPKHKDNPSEEADVKSTENKLQAEGQEIKVNRGRGRPRKIQSLDDDSFGKSRKDNTDTSTCENDSEFIDSKDFKRKRGRLSESATSSNSESQVLSIEDKSRQQDLEESEFSDNEVQGEERDSSEEKDSEDQDRLEKQEKVKKGRDSELDRKKGLNTLEEEDIGTESKSVYPYLDESLGVFLHSKADKERLNKLKMIEASSQESSSDPSFIQDDCIKSAEESSTNVSEDNKPTEDRKDVLIEVNNSEVQNNGHSSEIGTTVKSEPLPQHFEEPLKQQETNSPSSDTNNSDGESGQAMDCNSSAISDGSELRLGTTQEKDFERSESSDIKKCDVLDPMIDTSTKEKSKEQVHMPLSQIPKTVLELLEKGHRVVLKDPKDQTSFIWEKSEKGLIGRPFKNEQILKCLEKEKIRDSDVALKSVLGKSCAKLSKGPEINDNSSESQADVLPVIQNPANDFPASVQSVSLPQNQPITSCVSSMTIPSPMEISREAAVSKDSLLTSSSVPEQIKAQLKSTVVERITPTSESMPTISSQILTSVSSAVPGGTTVSQSGPSKTGIQLSHDLNQKDRKGFAELYQEILSTDYASFQAQEISQSKQGLFGQRSDLIGNPPLAPFIPTTRAGSQPVHSLYQGRIANQLGVQVNQVIQYPQVSQMGIQSNIYPAQANITTADSLHGKSAIVQYSPLNPILNTSFVYSNHSSVQFGQPQGILPSNQCNFTNLQPNQSQNMSVKAVPIAASRCNVTLPLNQISGIRTIQNPTLSHPSSNLAMNPPLASNPGLTYMGSAILNKGGIAEKVTITPQGLQSMLSSLRAMQGQVASVAADVQPQQQQSVNRPIVPSVVQIVVSKGGCLSSSVVMTTTAAITTQSQSSKSVAVSSNGNVLIPNIISSTNQGSIQKGMFGNNLFSAQSSQDLASKGPMEELVAIPTGDKIVSSSSTISKVRQSDSSCGVQSPGRVLQNTELLQKLKNIALKQSNQGTGSDANPIMPPRTMSVAIKTSTGEYVKANINFSANLDNCSLQEIFSQNKMTSLLNTSVECHTSVDPKHGYIGSKVVGGKVPTASNQSIGGKYTFNKIKSLLARKLRKPNILHKVTKGSKGRYSIKNSYLEKNGLIQGHLSEEFVTPLSIRSPTGEEANKLVPVNKSVPESSRQRVTLFNAQKIFSTEEWELIPNSRKKRATVKRHRKSPQKIRNVSGPHMSGVLSHPIIHPQKEGALLPQPAVEEEVIATEFSSLAEYEERQNQQAQQVEGTSSNNGLRLVYEITSDDGFSCKADTMEDAWKQVIEKVQDARVASRMKTLSYGGLDVLKLFGLNHNSVVYLVEQLYGAQHCRKYRFRYHKHIVPEEEEEPVQNPTGCARSEPFQGRKPYDMFSFLMSKYRQMPVEENCKEDVEMIHKSSRRATSMDLPMAMRFRKLQEHSREAVGVYRSKIHGRGLYCKRNIDAGEMVIEYAGEVIRSSLTDKREKYYESKGIGCYMFRIDDMEVVDATMHGTAARFINHSCDPNCYSKVINIDGKKHIVIFAMRPINRGEELTYDYKFPIEDVKIPCTCGSKKCRKYLN
ncbi:hypothetical protein CHS0354_013899 [Potamilus streckersoni]|uniref:[Histone H3]-lysine(4) N-trimethyltransferase n=1 Tax=Potamilus streckersoni TaxID=2493646 RepID=A0AAE0RXA7_9BIVA|nr:hypothetical protein CHS0354_013899 [Potamilus streckersoni]